MFLMFFMLTVAKAFESLKNAKMQILCCLGCYLFLSEQTEKVARPGWLRDACDRKTCLLKLPLFNEKVIRAEEAVKQ